MSPSEIENYIQLDFRTTVKFTTLIQKIANLNISTLNA